MRRLVPIEGSVHPRMKGSVSSGPLAAEAELEVTLMLRENPNGPALADVVDRLNSQPLSERNYYTHRQYVENHGASLEDMRKVRKFAHENGLTVVASDRGCRTMKLRGSAAQLSAAFGVRLETFTASVDGKLTQFHSHRDPIHVDEGIASVLTGVFGLDSRPLARPHYRRGNAQPRAGSVSYDPNQVAAAYNYPTTGGAGVTVGIIELGGTVSDADLTAYFQRLGLPKPNVIHVPVDGQAPVPDPNGADVEVALDVEVIGAMAPGCTIVIYDAPNTEQGFIDALMAAANDTVNKPVAVSISWGAPENQWSTAGMDGMNQAALAGASQGLVYTAAAGDNGATDGVADGAFHADHPSSAPNIVGCGGTNLQLNPNGTIAKESVWGGAGANGATGGGVSDHFGVPTYQSANGVNPVSKNPAHNAGRGVPDVAGNADPASGYNVTSNGQTFPVGGTSAVAPQWAALFALAAKQLGKGVGPVHGLLYAVDKGAFHDITVGNNGDGNNNGYPAATGYDQATGWGSPDGQKLVDELTNTVPTPSKPCPPCKGKGKGKGGHGNVTIDVHDGGTVNVFEK